MQELPKKEEKRIHGILVYRVRGLSYNAIAKIYKITAERIRQIIVKSKKYSQFDKLNIEVDKTQKYLSRKLKI